MKILLDTNFIITSVKQKLDFQEKILELGAEIVIPEEVIEELKKISEKKDEKGKDKDSAKLALEIIKKNNFQKIKLNNSNVDNGIVDYAKKNNIIVATLDKELKKRTGGKILVIKDKTNLEII